MTVAPKDWRKETDESNNVSSVVVSLAYSNTNISSPPTILYCRQWRYGYERNALAPFAWMKVKRMPTNNRDGSIDMKELMGLLVMHCRRKTIKTLLAGNDTQCFTTQQYLDTYIRVIYKGDKKCLMDLSLAETHLKSLGNQVREVKPGIWTRND